MAQEFKLPDLGEGIDSGDVVQVHVSEGDTIEAEQTVLEVETDKAVLEVPSPFAGKVTRVHVHQGDKVQVGAPLITVESDGQAKEEKAAAPESREESKAASPKEQKKEKAEQEKKAEEPEEQAPAEEVSAEAEEGEAESAPAPEQKPAKEKPAPSRPQRQPPPAPSLAKDREVEAAIPAGPATRRLARELGVDLEELAEAYPGERLTEQHVKDFVKGAKTAAAAPAAPKAPEKRAPDTAAAKAAAPQLPDFSQWGEIETVAFSSLQRKTADHVHHGWVTAPHVTQFDEAEIGGIETLRKRYRQRDESRDIRLTVTAFVLKAAAIALRAFPEFNSSLDLDNGQLILKKYYHIGLAVDTEAGLIVPVIRDVDRKRVLQLAQEMNALAERTRQRKIELSELRGGTFTVTNLGGIGGTAFTPIINYPEVAILGVSRGKEVPAIVDGQLRSKLMLPLSLSYDHRVINGADGARFLRKIVELLEDPELLLLEG